jgi:hypothetical protein
MALAMAAGSLWSVISSPYRAEIFNPEDTIIVLQIN